MFYQLLNPAMNTLLKSPAHGVISRRIMSVRYRGRKTGKRYATPVSYLRETNTVFCFTNGSWRHNFLHPHPVELRIRGRWHKGIAQASPASDADNTKTMARYFTAVPADAKFYGVRFDQHGKVEISTVARAAQAMTMIRIDLDNTRS